VTPEELAELRTPRGRDLVAALTPYDPGSVLARLDRLRHEHPASLVAVAADQARWRTRAAQRLGPEAGTWWWTADSVEQASRSEAADRRARLPAFAGAARVADLGCGAGLDTIALGRAGVRVLAVELDPLTAAVAAANVAEAGVVDRVEVRCADARAIDVAAEGCDAVFLDPARRAGGRRVLDPARWQPPLGEALALLKATGRGAIKVAPGLDHALVPPDHVLDLVSVGGDLVEAVISAPGGDRIRRRAVVLPSGASYSTLDPGDPPAVGPWGAWVVEPDDAVIRAGLVAQAAATVSGRLVDPRIAYITCDTEPPDDPRYHRFLIDEVLPWSAKAVRARLRERGVGRLEVKKRGAALDPEQVRRMLHLDRRADGSATLLLARIGHGASSRVDAVIAHRATR
jgi:SAM-dependent methyltransferase